ncbi:chromatin-remodeling complex subunit ies6 [Thecaphora frezii]
MHEHFAPKSSEQTRAQDAVVTRDFAIPASQPESSYTPTSLHSLPRPFKSASYTNKNRTKSLKQILQSRSPSERDARKKTTSAKSGAKQRLTGAAARAWARRKKQEEAESKPEQDEENKQQDEENKQQDEENQEPHNIKLQDTSQEENNDDQIKPKRDIPTYATVEAPPTLRPIKKYCDVTGLLAPYTDPKTRLRYHSVQVYEIIKHFGPGTDNAYLALRKDASEIK